MSPLDFGPLIFGGNVFGWTADADTSFDLLDRFTAAGGFAIDTADSYSAWHPGNTGGESEEIIGEWLRRRGKRDHLVIATKVCSHPQRPGLAPENIRAAIDDSLRRLGTDYVDLYFAHRDDPDVGQAEYLGAFEELVQAGKIREIGASMFTPERIRSASVVARSEFSRGFTISQDRYSLVERGLETEVLPTLAELGIVEQPFAALAAGFLTGKYRADHAAGAGDSPRAAGARKYLEDPRNLELLAVLDDVAAGHGVQPGSVAIAWLRGQENTTAPLASVRSAEQLPTLIDSFGLELSASELADLTRASAHAVGQ